MQNFLSLELEENSQELGELKKKVNRNSETSVQINKDIETYKEKLATLQGELTHAHNKNEVLRKEVEEKEKALTKLEKG